MANAALNFLGLLIEELTPVEEHAGMLFKRDDLFRPFQDMAINGGKVRQALSLVLSNLDNIRRYHGNTIATCSSVHSPQGIIVARVAKELGLRAVLGIGYAKSVDEACARHYNLAVARQLGCDVRVLARVGYKGVLTSKLRRACPHAFIIDFGMNAGNNRASIIDCISNQTKNIPGGIDNLVIPMGSAISACGILNGLAQHGISVPNIYMIQISGIDRFDSLKGLLQAVHGERFPAVNRRTYGPTSFTLVAPAVHGAVRCFTSFDHPYGKWLQIRVDDTLLLDGRYEAKAYDYLMKYIKLEGRSLFWIVGNSSPYFNAALYDPMPAAVQAPVPTSLMFGVKAWL